MEEVASTLALHGLSEYAAAFDTQGWDKMSDLYDIDSVDLEVLMKDVQMKPGHRVRLRKMLMNAKVAESLVALRCRSLQVLRRPLWRPWLRLPRFQCLQRWIRHRLSTRKACCFLIKLTFF